MASGQNTVPKAEDLAHVDIVRGLCAHKKDTGLLSLLASETFCRTDLSGVGMGPCFLPPLPGEHSGQKEWAEGGSGVYVWREIRGNGWSDWKAN